LARYRFYAASTTEVGDFEASLRPRAPDQVCREQPLAFLIRLQETPEPVDKPLARTAPEHPLDEDARGEVYPGAPVDREESLHVRLERLGGPNEVDYLGMQPDVRRVAAASRLLAEEGNHGCEAEPRDRIPDGAE
jgi:hypothetical protein